jgi:hypothetical protein
MIGLNEYNLHIGKFKSIKISIMSILREDNRRKLKNT